MAYRASGLNLVVNAIILWNTVYLSRAVSFVQGQGIEIPDTFLAQVAPLPWSHIALTGDYLWNEIDQPLERFRPIRANRFNPKSFSLSLAYKAAESPSQPHEELAGGREEQAQAYTTLPSLVPQANRPAWKGVASRRFHRQSFLQFALTACKSGLLPAREPAIIRSSDQGHHVSSIQ